METIDYLMLGESVRKQVLKTALSEMRVYSKRMEDGQFNELSLRDQEHAVERALCDGTFYILKEKTGKYLLVRTIHNNIKP